MKEINQYFKIPQNPYDGDTFAICIVPEKYEYADNETGYAINNEQPEGSKTCIWYNHYLWKPNQIVRLILNGHCSKRIEQYFTYISAIDTWVCYWQNIPGVINKEPAKVIFNFYRVSNESYQYDTEDPESIRYSNKELLYSEEFSTNIGDVFTQKYKNSFVYHIYANGPLYEFVYNRDYKKENDTILNQVLQAKQGYENNSDNAIIDFNLQKHHPYYHYTQSSEGHVDPHLVCDATVDGSNYEFDFSGVIYSINADYAHGGFFTQFRWDNEGKAYAGFNMVYVSPFLEMTYESKKCSIDIEKYLQVYSYYTNSEYQERCAYNHNENIFEVMSNNNEGDYQISIRLYNSKNFSDPIAVKHKFNNLPHETRPYISEYDVTNTNVVYNQEIADLSGIIDAYNANIEPAETILHTPLPNENVSYFDKNQGVCLSIRRNMDCYYFNGSNIERFTSEDEGIKPIYDQVTSKKLNEVITRPSQESGYNVKYSTYIKDNYYSYLCSLPSASLYVDGNYTYRFPSDYGDFDKYFTVNTNSTMPILRIQVGDRIFSKEGNDEYCIRLNKNQEVYYYSDSREWLGPLKVIDTIVYFDVRNYMYFWKFDKIGSFNIQYWWDPNVLDLQATHNENPEPYNNLIDFLQKDLTFSFAVSGKETVINIYHIGSTKIMPM